MWEECMCGVFLFVLKYYIHDFLEIIMLATVQKQKIKK